MNTSLNIVPWFIKRDRPDLLEQYQVPLDEYVDRCEHSLERWGDYAKHTAGGEQAEKPYRSNEYAGEIIGRACGNCGCLVVIEWECPQQRFD